MPAHRGVLGLAAALRDAGVIRSRAAFITLTLVRGSARKLQAGEYEVERATDTMGVLRLLETGRVKQHIVLHPEGATVTELAGELERERIASAAATLRVARDPAFLRGLGIPGPSVEGYLFPDTYQFVRGMTPEEILTRMVQRLRAKLTPDTLARSRGRGLDLHGLLTLASIIEREAVARDEMRLISAVFWNRLKLDMPLQADPTVQYALDKERRALTRTDLLVDHPFNTYRHPGVPPGPIASSRPGADPPPSRRTTPTTPTAWSWGRSSPSRSASSSCRACGGRPRSPRSSTVTSARSRSTSSARIRARSGGRSGRSPWDA